jgi:Bacterial Ig-like domain (group 2)
MSTFRNSGFIVSCVVTLGILSPLSSCGGSSSDSTIAKVAVTPTIVSVSVNGQQTFTANALDMNGNTVTGVTFTWASSATDVATITSNGVATGKSSGTSQITATASSQNVASAPVSLTVLPEIASVSITPINATIKAGEQQQFVATAKDAKGNIVPGAVFDWAISFSGVATIDKNGVVTAVSTGTVLVTASAGGITSPVATLNVTN